MGNDGALCVTCARIFAAYVGAQLMMIPAASTFPNADARGPVAGWRLLI